MNSHQNGTRNSDIATPHLEAAYMKHKKFGKKKKPTLNDPNDPDDPVFLAQSFSSSEPRQQQHQPNSPNIEIKKESNHNDHEFIKSEPEQETDEEISNEIPEKCQIGFPRGQVVVETTGGGGSSSLIKETNNKSIKIWRPCDSTHSTNTGSSNGAFRPVKPMVQHAPHPPSPVAPPQVTQVFSANLARCSRCKEIFKLQDIVRHLREQHGSIQEDYEIIKTLPSGASLELVPPPPPPPPLSLTTTAADHSRDTTNNFRVPAPVTRAAHPPHPSLLISAGIHNPLMTYDRLWQHAPHHPHAPPHHPHSSLTLTSQAHIQHHLLQPHLIRLAAAQQHSHGLIAQAHAAAAAAPGGHAGHPSSRPPLPGQLTLPHDIHLERMDSTTTKQEPLSPDSDIADTHSPNLSSPLSNDGSEGSKGSGTSRRKKKDEIVPWWVKVESIEDFKRHAENYCNTEQEMKDMVELRRKIKNRDAAQRSRLKRMKSTDDLKQENIYLKREYGKSKKDLDTVNQIKRDRITRIEELERRKTKIARACKRLSANYSKDKNNIIHPRD